MSRRDFHVTVNLFRREWWKHDLALCTVYREFHVVNDTHESLTKPEDFLMTLRITTFYEI